MREEPRSKPPEVFRLMNKLFRLDYGRTRCSVPKGFGRAPCFHIRFTGMTFLSRTLEKLKFS